jgi:hypothetical protein
VKRCRKVRWVVIGPWTDSPGYEYEFVVECESRPHALAVLAMLEWDHGWILPLRQFGDGWGWTSEYSKDTGKWRRKKDADDNRVTGFMYQALVKGGLTWMTPPEE